MITENKFVTINGLKIYVNRIGKGTPIVFLHGGPGGEHRYFLPHLKELADEFELIFYDQRGCGKSEEAMNKSYTLEEEVHTLEELRFTLGLKKLNLVGESWEISNLIREYFI